MELRASFRILRFQICFDVEIFGLEKGFDLDVLTLQKSLATNFWGNSSTWATKISKHFVTLGISLL
jgi:hypothetical protein